MGKDPESIKTTRITENVTVTKVPLLLPLDAREDK
jgi:hypothetical protein